MMIAMARIKLIAVGMVVVAGFSVLMAAWIHQRRRARELEDQRDLYCLRLAEEVEVATKAGDIKNLSSRMQMHLLNPWSLELCTGKAIPYRSELRNTADKCFIREAEPLASDRCYLELATEVAASYRRGRNAP